MNNRVNKITVVGGGTAGCIAALILKTKFPHKNVQIIESSNIGIVGVGESSTEHWSEFCKFVGINQLDAILHANATFKIGVYFKNWSSEDFMHSINPIYSATDSSYFYKYAYIISNNLPAKNLQSPKTWKNQFSLSNFNNKNDSPVNQYHFDTFSLNKFLHRECIKRNILTIRDDLIEVDLCNETGNITSVNSKENKYESDFFIDCSGFNKFIMEKTYNIPWKSYSEYLPLNSAIAFPTEEMEEYNKYTLSTARNAGWSWTIPVQGRTGNGYVYSDCFINKDEAHHEMEKCYDKSLNIVKEFKFNPGRLEKSWHKNCYAVGLSQSFVEPLEATSIGSVIQQMFCFTNFLPSYDSGSCNQIVNKIFDNIVDYVQAHYLIKREDTPFWKEIKYNLKLTSNLEYYLEIWKNRLPLDIDIFCPWGMFSAVNYIPILYGLKWFDIDKIRDEFLTYNYYDRSKEQIQTSINEENELFCVGHKNLINILKDNNN
tara:strand:+ start:1257 stop:2717 length:1461 start_codon:yes stop_codon:yes gene_type:complete